MSVPQEAFKEVEGKTLYRELCWALTDRYGAKPISQLADASWAGKVKIRVPDTPLGVVIQLERKDHEMVFESLYTEARIKIGSKRWLKLKWKDGKWLWDEARLFAKVDQEILRLKEEYVAQQSEKQEMAENRHAIALDLAVDEDTIQMQTPFKARIDTTWGHLLLAYDPDKPGRFRLTDIILTERRDLRVLQVELGQIIDTLDSILGEDK